MTRRKRIGIFGGTFDPIHNGHLRAAHLVQRRFSLDRIFFIPAFVPPHKARPDMAAAKARMRMVALAVRGRDGWSASPMEIRAGGTSYSILTIERLRRRYPSARLFFLTGADAFLEIRTWRAWQRVLRSCSFIVMTRPGFSLAGAARILGTRARNQICRLSRGAALREADLGDVRVYFVPIQALDVSSSEVRRRVRAGLSPDPLVPLAVAAYIRKHGLYREINEARRGMPPAVSGSTRRFHQDR